MRTFTLVLIASLLACVGIGSKQTRPVSEEDRVVGCFAAQESVVGMLAELGIKLGDTGRVRTAFGSVPGTTSGPPEAVRDEVQVVFYAADGQRAFIGFATASSDGRIAIWPNGYALARGGGGRWNASEGHGGIGTYAAVGRYVDRLEAQPMRTVKIQAMGGPRCTVLKIATGKVSAGSASRRIRSY